MRTQKAGRIYHLDSSYPLLPTLYLPTTLVANIDQSPRSLARPRRDLDSSILYICDDAYWCSFIRSRTASNHLDKVSQLTPSYLGLSILRVQTPL